MRLNRFAWCLLLTSACSGEVADQARSSEIGAIGTDLLFDDADTRAAIGVELPAEVAPRLVSIDSSALTGELGGVERIDSEAWTAWGRAGAHHTEVQLWIQNDDGVAMVRLRIEGDIRASEGEQSFDAFGTSPDSPLRMSVLGCAWVADASDSYDEFADTTSLRVTEDGAGGYDVAFEATFPGTQQLDGRFNLSGI